VTHYTSLGAVKPWVQAAADEVGTRFGISTIGGYGNRDNATDHDDGLALDFMTRSGGALAAYAQANAARLGVTYIIWNQQIWNISRAAEGWRPMADRGSPTANHKDHVHVSFGTSGPGGSTTGSTTVPSSSTAPNAAAVQALLNPIPWFGDKLKGQLDEATAGIVKAISGLAIAAVLVAGGVGLVVVGLSKTIKSS
jgi:hypothetical protein